MLRAVTFDYWNTLLVDRHGKERERRRAAILQAELAAGGLRPKGTEVEDALHRGFDYFDGVWLNERRTPLCSEIVDSILVALDARLGEAARDHLVHDFETLLLDLPPEPTPGAERVLPLLAKRYRLAVVCDTGYSPGSVLRKILERNGMLAYFDYLFFSNEHGMSKPDVRVFHHTLAELRVGSAEAAHVGDMQRTDIAGAQAAGMAAVHFVGANSHDAGQSSGDVIVRHFADLPAALDGLVRAGS
jgi:putative hydrolase of the HAD superfamily